MCLAIADCNCPSTRIGSCGGRSLRYLVAVLGLLPASRLKNVLLRRVAGYRIGSRVVIDPCLLLNVDQLILGDDTFIGLLTTLRDLRSVELGRGAHLGRFNWVTAARTLRHQSEGHATLKLDEGAGVTSRHYVDCSGGIRIGKYSTVAGVRSVFSTHGIETAGCWQVGTPIVIGEFCLISSCVRIVPGVTIADRCVVAMGAVVADSLTESDGLYAGVPAIRKRAVSGDYFRRTDPNVAARP